MEGSIEPQTWDEDQRPHRPASNYPVAAEAASVELESPEAALEMARALADRLARVRTANHQVDAVRLARAMALNVVDLLESAARR